MFNRRLIYVLIIGLAVFSFSPLETAENTGKSVCKPRADYTVQVNLTQVDFIALDGNDQHIRDLTKDDIELYINGDRVKIARFDKFEYEKAISKTVKVAETKTPISKEEEVLPPRYYSFAIYNAPKYDLQKRNILKAIQDFSKAVLRPDDKIAVYHIDDRVIAEVLPYTADKEKAYDTIEKYIESDLFKRSSIVYRNPFDLSELRGAIATETLTEFNTPDLDGGRAKMLPPENKQSDQMLKEALMNEQNTLYLDILEKLSLLGQTMKEIPGRKNVILVTAGLYFWGDTYFVDMTDYNPLTRSDGPRTYKKDIGSSMLALKQSISSFNTYNMSLYVLDVGKRTANSIDTSSVDVNTENTQNAMMAEMARTQSLQQYSGYTGGEFIKSGTDTENLVKTMEKVERLSSLYYLLSFYPGDKYKPGEVLDVKIKTDRDDVKLSYRSQIAMPKQYNQLTSDEKQWYLNNAALSGIEFNELSLCSDYYFFPTSSVSSLILMISELDIDEIIHEKMSSKLNISFIAKTLDGAEVRSTHKIVTVDFSDTLRKKKVDKISYFDFITLPPGDYTIRYFINDVQTGKNAAINRQIKVPLYTPSEANLGSMIVLNSRENIVAISEFAPYPGRDEVKINPDNPLYLSGTLITPEIGIINPSIEKLLVFLNAKGLKDSGNIANYKWSLKKVLNERSSSANDEISKVNLVKEVPHKNGSNGLMFALDIKPLSRGEYLLECSYFDERGQEYKSSRELSVDYKGMIN
ncbi:MAG: VWA domain-containing protein [Acidobacteria bacterium]|nr:VWA domain-containing protein [Acidobacteriota bacterium]